MSLTHVLYESASGYGLFQVQQAEKVGSQLAEVQATINDLSKFGKFIKATSFAPFKNAADALENINDVSEGQCSESLKAFLELNLPKGSKSVLGVSDKNLAGSIKASPCVFLAKIVADHYRYARLAKAIKNKATLGDDSIDMLTEITEDQAQSQQIVDAARASMGTDISDIDLLNIETFAARVISLSEYRK
ncbi:Nucleolar protein 56, partial [Coemansia sp. RSA 2673]